MRVQRAIHLENLLKPGKVLILYGARRVGKTTLLKEFLAASKLKYRLDSGDNLRTRQLLEARDFQALADYVEGYQLLAIDEAQQVPEIARALKILVDEHPSLRVIATGSSSFDLAQSVGEPLTGRKRTAVLHPLSLLELSAHRNAHDLREDLPTILRFGLYPEVVTTKGVKGKEEVLRELVDSYLLKDVLSLEKIRGSRQLFDLLKLVAFQIGNEVSLSELATQVRLDVKTVARYLDILEKAFVLRRVGALSGNLRNEVTRKAKYYFCDVGIRNAVIGQFNSLDDRDDVGRLFENFVVMERRKVQDYGGKHKEVYFWRTYGGQEVDYVEERGGTVRGFEIKWSPDAKLRVPSAWRGAFPGASVMLVTRENFLPFVTGAKT